MLAGKAIRRRRGANHWSLTEVVCWWCHRLSRIQQIDKCLVVSDGIEGKQIDICECQGYQTHCSSDGLMSLEFRGSTAIKVRLVGVYLEMRINKLLHQPKCFVLRMVQRVATNPFHIALKFPSSCKLENSVVVRTHTILVGQRKVRTSSDLIEASEVRNSAQTHGTTHCHLATWINLVHRTYKKASPTFWLPWLIRIHCS